MRKLSFSLIISSLLFSGFLFAAMPLVPGQEILIMRNDGAYLFNPRYFREAVVGELVNKFKPNILIYKVHILSSREVKEMRIYDHPPINGVMDATIKGGLDGIHSGGAPTERFEIKMANSLQDNCITNRLLWPDKTTVCRGDQQLVYLNNQIASATLTQFYLGWPSSGAESSVEFTYPQDTGISVTVNGIRQPANADRLVVEVLPSGELKCFKTSPQLCFGDKTTVGDVQRIYRQLYRGEISRVFIFEVGGQLYRLQEGDSLPFDVYDN